MDALFNAAAINGGSYNDAAVLGGWVLARDATKKRTGPLTSADLRATGQKVWNHYPKKTQDNLLAWADANWKKIGVASAEKAKKSIVPAIGLLYIMDSLRAMTQSPNVTEHAKKLARQRWLMGHKSLMSQSDSPTMKVYRAIKPKIHLAVKKSELTPTNVAAWKKAINAKRTKWGKPSQSYSQLPRIAPGGMKRLHFPDGWNKVVPAAKKKKTA